MKHIASAKFLFLSFLCFLCGGMSMAQNLGVYPTQLDFALSNGQNESQAITLSNGSAKKVQFRLYLNDWVRDSLGGHIYYDAKTQPRSCAAWVTLSKDFVELEPGQSEKVNVKLQVPDGAVAVDEMKWTMLFVETVEEKNTSAAKKTEATINNLLRIGVHIYQTPPNLTKKQVKAIELKKVDKTNDYRLLCQNVGEVMLECKSYLELTLIATGKKTKLDPIEFPLFPEQRRYVTFQLPANIDKGKYAALAVVDCGEDVSLEAVESQIEVK